MGRDASALQFRTVLTACLLTLLISVVARAADSAADTDFLARCAAPGVIRCWDFDSISATAPHLFPDAYGSRDNAEISTDVKASGSGALRFRIPPTSGPNSSGSFWLDFSDDNSAQFGEGQEFFLQFRQRFSPEFLNAHYAGGGGWKTVIIGEGDRLGYVANSCSDLEIVTHDNYYRGFPQMYHNCGTYGPLSQQIGSEFLLQNAVPCLYSTRKRPDGSPCVLWKPNNWMTFQYHVKIGHWNQPDSTVEMWVAYENEPSQLVVSLTDVKLINPKPAQEKYGKVWLLPYNTDKDPKVSYPVAYTWYDELIISHSRIQDPMVKTPIPPTDLVATSEPGRIVLRWSDSGGGAQYSIQRCANTAALCNYHPETFKTITTTRENSYADIRGNTASPVTYRVRAQNAHGPSAWSNAAAPLSN